MNQVGFDSEKYIRLQSEHIRERINQFGGKLYLEFGGKLFDDYHASRVLPGFAPDNKIKMLLALKDQAEIVIAINAGDIEKNKRRGDLGITYDTDVARLIDVFRGRQAEKNFIDFTAFVLAFPQLTMGPILRYDEWRGALKARTIAREDIFLGFECFTIGLCFKVLLADQLAPLWASLERIGYGYLSAPLAWLGAVSYSLQLYFDFSGYSLMAMGLGQMLALPVPRNFDLPYTARSVSEFYRRWHITLGTWFRDYVYIPLGGSRRGKARTALALTVVWVFTGLWHGASWNFVLWGVMLLAFILLEKFCIGSFLKEHKFLSHLYLLFVIPQTWVVFRITKLSDVGAYFSRLFPFFGTHSAVSAQDALKLLASYWWLLILGVFFCLPQPRRFYEKHRGSLLLDLPLFLLFWVCVYFTATSAGSAFLYSRF